MKKNLLIISFFLFSIACNPAQHDSASIDDPNLNPPMEGFNLEGSDPKAIALADSVMEAMGGRRAWDEVRYISWNFFGARDLVWDKFTGRVRIDFPRDSAIYLINVHTDTGRVSRGGVEITQPDSLAKYIQRGKSIWINDSYWLVMPFKLKDSGVTLKYDRTDTTLTGVKAEVLNLTFNQVGDTPENMYEVFIDKKDHLVKQWTYYRSNQQDSASAIWPWDNYKMYDGILLSGDRSDDRGPKNVAVYKQLPDEVFNSFNQTKIK